MTPTLELAPVLEAPPVSDEAHARLVQSLQNAGLLTALPTHPGQTTPFEPILVQGRPVSETLLEDRR